MMRTRIGRGASTAVALVAALSTRGVAQKNQVAAPRPTIGPAKPYAFPKIATRTLSNGLRIAVIENHELPIVAVRVGFSGGSFLDAPGKEGQWALMTAALREGTTTRSSDSIGNQLADLGTSVVWPVTDPFLGNPSFTTIRSAWLPALGLVADMLMNPSFPADRVARLQANQAAAAARPSQGTMQTRVTVTNLFGPAHPYARFPSDSSIRRLTRDDLVSMQSSYLRPQNTTIVIAGDVTPGEAESGVEKIFSGWRPTGSKAGAIVVEAPPPSPTTIYLRDLPGAPQSLIMSGSTVPRRGGPDNAALDIADAILGASNIGSRMYQAFRIARGLSYSPSSFVVWKAEPQPGYWLQTAGVPTAKTDSAIVEWMRVIRDMHGDRPVTPTELDFTRRNILGAMAVQFETLDAVATRTLGLSVSRLPLTFYNDYPSRLNAVTLAQVQAAAAKYLDPDHIVIVVTGDRAKIEGPLRATGIPVVIVDH